MAIDAVTALIVPHGKIADYINGKFRKDTPEEYVRQEIEKSLVHEYKYPPEEIGVEFSIKVGGTRARVDLAIFPAGSAHTQEHVIAIAECKAADVPPNHKSDGIEQLKSYLEACANAEFGLWTNGQERYCCRKVTKGKKHAFEEVVDLPVRGRPLDDAERPTFATLKKASSDALLFAFRRCHDYIAANQGLQKPEAFWELLKLIFCKITDERAPEIRFYATTAERQSMNGQAKAKARLGKLFAVVRGQFPTIFRENETIELEPRVLAYLVAQLQPYSLLESDVDVKGKAYEEVVGSNLRGARGEFFTPRNICRMAVEMIDPDADQLLLDPSCGTGGFLVTAMNHVRDKIKKTESARWKKADQPSISERARLDRHLQDFLSKRIVGIDLNPNLVKAAKMNMVMNNDGAGELFQGNSLARSVTWGEDLRTRDLLGKVDLVFTNPPFGAKLSIDDPAILAQYDLAHSWDYDAAKDTYALREPRVLTKSQAPEILFIERCVQFLKPGRGIACMVLPDAILGAPGLAYVREWILRNTRVLASVDLHPDTFQPKNSTQTSLLVLRRKSQQEIDLERAAGEQAPYDVFMALANHIGHNKRGNTTYVRDEHGNERVEIKSETIRDPLAHSDTPAYRRVEVRRKVVDDNTREIAAQFRAWWGAQP